MNHITIRTDNSPAGIARIEELWNAVMSGRIPLLTQAAAGEFPIARYSRYENGMDGAYDLTILLASVVRIKQLEDEAVRGIFRRYEASGRNVATCVAEVWQYVWRDEEAGILQRAYTQDFEVSTPAEYTPDGVARCTLYIAVQKEKRSVERRDK